MKTKLSKHLRRTSIFFNALGTLSIIVSLVVAFFPQGAADARPLGPPPPGGGGSGAIWTTLNSCGTPEQNINEFFAGDEVYINGSNFDAITTYAWSITGQPHSGDPSTVVASGNEPTDANGVFCFTAYTIQPGDWGVYKYDFGGKNDPYHVTAAGVGSIDVQKDASPTTLPETGGNVIYTVTVANTDVSIGFSLTSLVDDVFGDLNGEGTCAVPQPIAPLGSYICTFTKTLAQEAGTSHTDTVTGSGTDANANPLSDFDPAAVTFTDVLPVITVVKTAAPTSVWEPGNTVSFTVTVTNTVLEALTITSLTDSVFGNLSGQGSCSVPQPLAPLGSYTCTFSAAVIGQPGDVHTDVVTAIASDNDGNSDDATDDAAVTFNDILPSINIVKTAAPTLVPETGGPVTYSLTVTNTSAEAITLDSLVDDVYGNLDGQGTCNVPQTLAASGGSYSCTFNEPVSGYAGQLITDWIDASASDDDGNTATARDDASVTIQDVGPNVGIDKSANPTSVPETGGTVTYTVVVTNTGSVTIWITALNDDRFGNLFLLGDCGSLNGVQLAPAGSDSCTFDRTLSGPAPTSHTNVATVTAIDNEQTPVSASDNAVVTFTDVLPDIEVEKTPNVTAVPETGGNVTFTITVTNYSTIPVTLEYLNDTIFGDLTTACALPQTLAASGGSHTCSLVDRWLFGEPGTPHINVVTATAYDAQRNSDTDSDDARVDFTNVVPTILVIKTADPTSVSEMGGNVTFTVQVINTSDEAVTLNSLIDDVFGDLNGQGDCSVPQSLAAENLQGDSYTCSFTKWMTGEPSTPHVDIVIGTATDNEGSTATDDDPATVTFTDVLPVITVVKTADPTSVWEPGASVNFTVTVNNTVLEALTLTSLTDSVFGNLNGQGSCSVPQPLAPLGSYTCTFSGLVSGQPINSPHVDVVTAVASDNDGNSDDATDDAAVTINDILPSITVVKTANPTVVPETGGTVTYSLTVTNTSAEQLLLTSLVDDIYGNLNGQGTCSVPQTLAASGGSYSCTFNKPVSGNAGQLITDWIDASASDNDGNTASARDDATVTIQDVGPNVGIEKSANPTSVPETGGNVTYTVVVTNTGAVSITISALNDDRFGNLFLLGDCGSLNGITLAPTASDTCTFVRTLSGPGGSSHTNVATVTAIDNEQTPVSASDDAVVSFTDILPDIEVVKTADPTWVPEAGGNVTFTFVVTNYATVPVTLTVLNDTIFGDLNGRGTCTLPQTLAASGGSYSCSFTEWLAGDPAAPHIDVVTATAYDAQRNSDTATDDARVDFVDILPEISVAKSPSTGYVFTPGGNVTFTVVITNLTVEPVTITSLVDSVFGDLNGRGDCTVPQDLAAVGDPDDTYICTFTAYIAGPAGALHNNIVTASGADDDQNPVSADNQAFVRVLAIVTPPPFIPVTGVDLGASELPLSSLGFASLGIMFFGLGFVTRGYANRREEDEA